MTRAEVEVRRWQAVMMNNYGTPRLALERGDGAYVWDRDGNRYLDLLAGIAVNALGHAHPAVVSAITAQARTLGHTSNLYLNGPALDLAERLLDLAGVADDGRVFLCNSGAEAVETALKLARRTGRTKIVATTGGFHGRTMGALSLTGQPAKREPFQPLVPGVSHIPFGDVEALMNAVDGETAAFIVEPIQGEAGVVVPPDDYLRAARAVTADRGALLIVDEVQTGIGRLGTWFGFQRSDVVPDVFTLAKGLGGGLPLGACIAVGAAAELFEPGQHGTTFGGNPISCAASLAMLDTVAADGLLKNAAMVGDEILLGTQALGHPLVADVRGVGLLLGIRLQEDSAVAVTLAAQRAGYLVNPVQPDVVRLAPPLILDRADALRFVADLPTILEESL